MRRRPERGVSTETTRQREAGDRRGVDGLTRRLIEHGKETGQPVAYDRARAQAAEIARRTDAERKK